MSRLRQLPENHLVARIGWLRAAVLGANDGLLSNFSLVMGVIGAAFSTLTILITGLAGLLAGAGSMGWASGYRCRVHANSMGAR